MPWNFLGERGIFCSNELTLGGLLAGLVTKKTLIRNLEISTLSHPLGRGEGLEMQLVMDGACVKKPP